MVLERCMMNAKTIFVAYLVVLLSLTVVHVASAIGRFQQTGTRGRATTRTSEGKESHEPKLLYPKHQSCSWDTRVALSVCIVYAFSNSCRTSSRNAEDFSHASRSFFT